MKSLDIFTGYPDMLPVCLHASPSIKSAGPWWQCSVSAPRNPNVFYCFLKSPSDGFPAFLYIPNDNSEDRLFCQMCHQSAKQKTTLSILSYLKSKFHFTLQNCPMISILCWYANCLSLFFSLLCLSLVTISIVRIASDGYISFLFSFRICIHCK